MLELYPYQKIAVDKTIYYLNKSGFCYNASQQRLGKMIEAIDTARQLKVDSVLIIGPKSVQITWIETFNEWYEEWKLVPPLMNSVTYNYLINKTHKLKSNYDLIIVDEAQAFKNPKAKRTEAFFTIVRPCSKNILFLSGTPITNSVVDLFPVWRYFIPKQDRLGLNTRHKFGKYFAAEVQHTIYGTTLYIGYKRPKVLSQTIREHFYFRDTRKQVAPELPAKQYNEIILPSGYLNKLSDKHLNKLDHLVETNQLNSEAAETAYRKLPYVVDFIRELLDQGEPVVVYAYHRRIIDELTTKFKSYNPVVITGSTSAINRNKAIKRFQQGVTDLFIGQISAAGSAVTLSRSNEVVLAELVYDAGALSQVSDRCISMVKKEPVRISYFVAKGYDKQVLRSVVIKAKTIDAVINKN